MAARRHDDIKAAPERMQQYIEELEGENEGMRERIAELEARETLLTNKLDTAGRQIAYGCFKLAELEAIGHEIVESLSHGQIDLNDECSQKLIRALNAGGEHD